MSLPETNRPEASRREPSLLGQLDPEAFVVEVAALLDVLGTEHETVRLGLPRSKGALFARDLRAGQAARGVVRSSPREVLLPDHVEAVIRSRPGVDLQFAGWMARAVARDLEVGRRLRFGLPPLGPASSPTIKGGNRSKTAEGPARPAQG